MRLYGEPEAEIEPPEPFLTGLKCRKCGYEFTEGELYGECGGELICDECVDREWDVLSVYEKFEILGYEPTSTYRRIYHD